MVKVACASARYHVWDCQCLERHQLTAADRRWMDQMTKQTAREVCVLDRMLFKRPSDTEHLLTENALCHVSSSNVATSSIGSTKVLRLTKISIYLSWRRRGSVGSRPPLKPPPRTRPEATRIARIADPPAPTHLNRTWAGASRRLSLGLSRSSRDTIGRTPAGPTITPHNHTSPPFPQPTGPTTAAPHDTNTYNARHTGSGTCNPRVPACGMACFTS